MKVYTEVNYEFQNGVLVEQSSKSYNYTGEVSLCKGGGGNPIKNVVSAVAGGVEKAQSNVSGAITDNPVTAKVPDASLLTENLTGAMQDNPLGSLVANVNDPLKDMNIPDASHATSMLTTGLEKLGGNIGEVVQGVADPIIRNVNEAGKVIQKAVTGSAGYADEYGGYSGGGSGGGTGSEEAVGTMLTQSRKKERMMGRSYHSGGGSASTV